MPTVTSRDGTTLAYSTLGSGPALLLVDGALCSRQFGPIPGYARALADSFTVHWYDRRGRGESGDTPPYSVAREVEDLAAMVEAAGALRSSSAPPPAPRSPSTAPWRGSRSGSS